MRKKKKNMSEELGTYTIKVDDTPIAIDLEHEKTLLKKAKKQAIVSSIDITNKAVLIENLEVGKSYLLKDLQANTTITFKSFNKIQIVKCNSISHSMIVEACH